MHQTDLFPEEAPQLPPYTVRESSRAKRVSIRVSIEGDVEVVVPSRFDRKQLPEMMQQRRDWILKTQAKLKAERADTVEDWDTEQPEQLDLQAISEVWKVAYQAHRSPTLCIPGRGKTLKIRGRVDHLPTCHELLRQWLTHKAHKALIPWMRQLSFDIDLPFKQISIRGQKTRWASCSERKDISLNYKLLFLPQPLVEYVLIHELCHTVHMNHSKQFWQLVEAKQPDYLLHRQAIKKGWQYVPRWLET
ncbi:MAG: M48 family metallopeptidase [Leptolyngbya sp. SIO4C1]|nr:M48 family metallopeptidase [Leptolyngbya sp. SIO4C1]